MAGLSDNDIAAVQSFLDEEFGGNEGGINVEPAEAPSDGDTPELKIDAHGRAHDPETGKFVAHEGEEQPEEESPEDSAEEEVPADDGIEPEEESGELVYEIDDPELLDLLDKYDGDVVKALKAAREAQSLIGRQGNELGELRQMHQQLLEAMQNQPQQPVYVGPYQNDVDENPEALVYEALERGDGNTMQRALEAWGEVDPFRAAIFVAALPQMLVSAEQQYEQQPQPTTSLESEFAALKERHPDVDKHLQGIQQVLTERPHLNAAVASGDPSARARAFEDAYLLARSQSSDSDTSVAARRVVLRARAEAEQAKEDAAVVSASKTSAAEAPPTGDALLEQALKGILGNDDFEIV